MKHARRVRIAAALRLAGLVVALALTGCCSMSRRPIPGLCDAGGETARVQTLRG